jgi:hypothetical protein
MALYQTGWLDIQEFDTGYEVATNLKNSFANIDTALVVVQDNETRSKNNETEIASIGSDVTQLKIDVYQLTNVQYEYSVIQSPITITDDVDYTEIVSVDISELNVGVFEYKLSLRWSISTTNSSAMFRYALIRNDETSPTWFSFDQEVKDKTNDIVSSLFYPINELNRDKVKFVLEGKVEAAGQTITVDFADVIIDQKK